MATHNTHPPTPSTNTQHYADTDHRESWPIWYAIFFGAPLGVIGFGFSGLPVVYIGLTVLALVIVWLLHRYGVANDKPRLANVPAEGAGVVAVIALVLGVIAWAIGAFTGTWLVSLVVGITELSGIAMPLVALAVSLLASIGLLLATSYQHAGWTIACLVFFVLTVLFITQQGMSATGTPFELLKAACETHGDAFVAECR